MDWRKARFFTRDAVADIDAQMGKGRVLCTQEPSDAFQRQVWACPAKTYSKHGKQSVDYERNLR